MATINSASGADWNTGSTWAGGAVPGTGDRANIQHAVTLAANPTNNIQSLAIDSGGTLTCSNTPLITVTGGGDGSVVFHQGTLVNDCDLAITGGAGKEIASIGTGNFNDITLNNSGNTLTIANGALTIDGDLTITAGTLDTSGSNRALTVAGATSIGDGSASADTATLTCNASTISLGSGYSTTWGLQVERGGTFAGGSGTHTMGSLKLGAVHADVKCTLTSGVTTLDDEKSGDNYTLYLQDSTFDDANGTVTVTHNGQARFNLGGEPLHNVIINHADCIMEMSSAAVINNDLTITAGQFRTYYSGTSYALTVTGDVDITGDLLGDDTAISMGSLTITADGEYSATSGVTTITSETAGNKAIDIDGTFTHNGGTVTIITPAATIVDLVPPSGNGLNNLIINHSSLVAEWGANATIIKGDLTITAGRFAGYSGIYSLTVDGHVSVTGTLTGQNADISCGSLTINSGGTYTGSTATTTINGGFHNDGTLSESGGIIEMTGTGGILNATVTNLHVNQDPVYGNFNATTSVLSSTATDFDSLFDGNGGCVSAWIYPKSIGEGSQGRIFDKGDDWYWKFSAANTLLFEHGFDGTSGQWTSGSVVPYNAWSHIAIVYDNDAVGNNPVFYLNGVASSLTETTTPVGTREETSATLYIGNRSANDRTFDGYIMDAKIYKAVAVTAPQVTAMAKKINVESSDPGLPTSGIQLWAKLNASTTADSSGESNTLTAANMGSVVYDAFTTDAAPTLSGVDNFEVKSGILNLNSRASVDFVPSSDYITVGAAAHLEFGDGSDDSAFTFSAWIQMDDATSFDILQKHHEWRFGTDAADKVYLRLEDGGDSVFETATYNTALTSYEGKWVHLVATYNGVGGTSANGGISLYVNGVSVATTLTDAGSYTALHDDMNGDIYMGRQYGVTVTTNGHQRDTRIYDYELSADQVASLYSGSYNVTPAHWWKMNEGAGATATIVDSGTGTTANGTGTSLTWENTNFTVDRAARIHTNGGMT